MNSINLRLLLPQRAYVMLYDSSYGCPTKDWLLKKFYPWFKETRWQNDISRWTRKNDCDNFAAAFHVYAQDAHALTTQGDEGLAVGIFCYFANKPGLQGAHAINCAVVENDELIFIEPQTGEQYTLTQQEIDSCFFVCF